MINILSLPMIDIKRLFEIDPSSPSGLRWKVSPARNVKAGDFAGSSDGKGYYQVKINTVKFRTHRIVWAIVNGDIPDGMTIDHKDRDTGNNCISNLRLATSGQQCSNRIRKKQGCIRVRKNGRLEAAIVINGVSHSKSSRDRVFLEGWLAEKAEKVRNTAEQVEFQNPLSQRLSVTITKLIEWWA